MSGDLNERMRRLPAVDRVVSSLPDLHPRVAASLARRAVDAARERVAAGEDAPEAEAVAAAARALQEEDRLRGLVPVVNATGVLVHTNLGRVPLGAEQLEAVTRVAGGYSSLEYDLVAGRRGSRYGHARSLLTELTGAEDALVVNNCAAAVLLVLSALCRGREVLISRGELVEIGGEFRIPDIMAGAGARLVEVGTTNRTHLADYERAITPESAAIFKVHPSNYRVVGFTATVAPRDLARLARGRGLPFVHDLGSGLVDAPELDWEAGEGWQDEPPVAAAIADGADLVTFSGDKLLGGPQAGIVAGRRELVERLTRSSLLRAVRVDKMTLAGLEATLRMHVEGRSSAIPVWGLASVPPEDLERRARSIVRSLEDRSGAAKVEAVPLRAVLGGGSVPEAGLRSWGVAVAHPERAAQVVAERLRLRPVPVVGRVEDDRVILDLRTVFPEQDALLVEATADELS
ncbi:MAG TPA: L-seryl-tRNA(Sec) selenium transferase [Actinomycetota bacterium]|nr:L-seryl-tRNA(Sec) selenium transferase [Actinomycetota bacterium]